MEAVEQATIQACIREVHSRIGYKDFSDIAKKLVNSSESVHEKDVRNWLYGRPVGQDRAESIARMSLDLLCDHAEDVLAIYRKSDGDTAVYLSAIMRKYRPMADLGPVEAAIPSSMSGGSAGIVFQNWTAPSKRDHGSLRTGLYQTFRRYKPTRGQKLRANPDWDWNDISRHAIICELIYLDLERRECKLVTGDMNVYHGSLYITHEDILYGILHRLSDTGNGVHQRFIASKIERPKFAMYSGIMVKIGNISIRPVAAEFFYVPMVKEKYPELYEAFQPINERQWSDTSQLDDGSIIGQYISITPPQKARTHADWDRVCYVGHFPILDKISRRTKNYIALFREPLRTLSAETLADVIAEAPLQIFQQGQFGPLDASRDAPVAEANQAE